jgi:hypothetical protein
MANHVHTAVTFYDMNDAAKKKLKEFYSKVRQDGDYRWFADMFVSDELPYEQLEKYEWTVNNIGPKWCYFEDYDDDYFVTESAWDSPIPGIEMLLAELSKVDPDFITTIRYEDEMPNFVGAVVYKGDAEMDYRQDEFEELVQIAEGLHPKELGGKFDYEENEWKDEEARDFFWEIEWELVNDLQDDFITEVLEDIK